MYEWANIRFHPNHFVCCTCIPFSVVAQILEKDMVGYVYMHTLACTCHCYTLLEVLRGLYSQPMSGGQSKTISHTAAMFNAVDTDVILGKHALIMTEFIYI